MFHLSPDTRDLGDLVNNHLALPPEPLRLSILILGYKRFDSRDQPNDLFLGDLHRAANRLIRRCVQPGSFYQISSTDQDARALRPTYTLTTAKTDDVGALIQIPGQILAGRQHRCGIADHREVVPVCDLRQHRERNVARTGERRYEMDDPCRIGCNRRLDLFRVAVTAFTYLNKLRPGHQVRVVVVEAMLTLDDQLVRKPVRNRKTLDACHIRAGQYSGRL